MDLASVLAGISQLGYGFLQNGMLKIGHQFRQRFQHKPPLVQSRMRDLEVGGGDDLAVVEEDVDVYGAGGVTGVDSINWGGFPGGTGISGGFGDARCTFVVGIFGFVWSLATEGFLYLHGGLEDLVGCEVGLEDGTEVEEVGNGMVEAPGLGLVEG